MTKDSRSNSGEQKKEPKKQANSTKTSRGNGQSRSSKAKDKEVTKASAMVLFKSILKNGLFNFVLYMSCTFTPAFNKMK
jgi:hypothetical protein